jgi:hypothetical protein
MTFAFTTRGRLDAKGGLAMPRGASPRREREYEELKGKFKRHGRYKGREEEVASRIVNKQRSEYGETKGQKAKKRRGQRSDADAPLKNYKELTVSEVKSKIHGKADSTIKDVKKYERSHKNRKTLIAALDRELKR